MEKERKFKIVALVAVIIAVIGLSIAFAAMSRTLSINGSGNVDPANWDIYFTNLSQPTLKGEASVSGTPTLATKGVTISNMNVTLKKPNDSVVYTVDIKNDGDIDAEIENLVLPTFTSAQQQLFDFTVVYTNGGQAVSIGDTLAKGETRNVTITFKYKDITDESLLPSTAQQISLSYQIIYKQTNNAVTTAAQGSQYGNEIASKEIAPGIFATYYGGTPMAKSETGIVQMSNDSRVADDVRYSGGTLVISGVGAIPDADWENVYPPVLLFLGNVSTVDELEELWDEESDRFLLKYNPINLIIEEGITSIGDFSFSYISSISNVVLPNTLIEIGQNAFSNASITSLRIPSGVTSIADDAFDGCFSLTSIRFASGTTHIENLNFDLSSSVGGSLSAIYIPSSVISVGNSTNAIYRTGVTVYCETQTVATLIENNRSNLYLNTNPPVPIVVDPTKFQ